MYVGHWNSFKCYLKYEYSKTYYIDILWWHHGFTTLMSLFYQLIFWLSGRINMMMSWHGSIFCITGPLWRESSGHWWIWGALEFLWCQPKQTVEQTLEWLVIWDAMVPMGHHCNEVKTKIIAASTLLVWFLRIIHFIIPPHNKVVGGYIGFTLSVCPSVHPSVPHPVSAL